MLIFKYVIKKPMKGSKRTVGSARLLLGLVILYCHAFPLFSLNPRLTGWFFIVISFVFPKSPINWFLIIKQSQ